MLIKEKIEKDLKQTIKDCIGVLPKKIHLEHPENPVHGDYSSCFALSEFETAKKSTDARTPLILAQKIIRGFPKRKYLKKIDSVSPGFINFYLSEKILQNQVKEILEEQGDYGINQKEKEKREKRKIQIEFISANPTGPLHVGNCRGGFSGDVLANILEKLGYNIQREYYINDRGLQIKRLGHSLEARYKQLLGQKIDIPEDGYPGDYLREIAKKIKKTDAQDFEKIALKEVLKIIKKTIKRMNIKYDCWFSEKSLYKNRETEEALELLKKKRLFYEKDNAKWFRSTAFNDDKDRVIVKSNGQATYVLSDMAYHLNKFKKRGFNKVILFWGADHHGYIPRFLGIIEAIGYKGRAQVELYQLVRLSRAGKKIRMSKRKGEYITVDDLLDEIGIDAARFHFLMHSLNRPMVLDLSKAAEKSKDNPVYYVQYAHARICSVLRKVKRFPSQADLSLLQSSSELDLIKTLIRFPEILLDAAENHQFQALPVFALRIADLFHKFYETCRILGDDQEITAARLWLAKSSQIILAETLRLMGVSSPEKM